MPKPFPLGGQYETANLCELWGCGRCPGMAYADECGYGNLGKNMIMICDHECHSEVGRGVIRPTPRLQ